MTNRYRSLVALAVLACLTAAAGALHAAPKSVKATYGGYMNGMAVGVITEHFDADGASYRILSETKPVGLAAILSRQPLRFASRGDVTREGLRPAHFEARRNAGDAPQITAEFDWAIREITLRHDGRLESFPLSPGTQDRLSIMYQFMFMRLERTRMVEFSMTNGRKLDRYRYRIVPDVELETALGRLKTLHLVKERDPGDTAAEVWISPRHQNVAVKLVIVERDGIRFEQVIQSLELRE
jgi:hypothetical protein